MTKRKGIAFLAMLAMVFGLVFPKAAMTAKATDLNLTVKFTHNHYDLGDAGSVDITSVGSVNNFMDENGVELALTDEIVLSGFSSDKMECKVTGDNNFSTTLTVNNNKTTLGSKTSEGGYPSGTLTFDIVAKQTGGQGGNDPSNDTGGNFPEPEPKIVMTIDGTDYPVVNDTVIQLDKTSLDDLIFTVKSFEDLQNPSKKVTYSHTVGNSSALTGGPHGMNPLEVRTITKTKTMWTFGLEYYADEDSTYKDSPVYGFMIQNITIITKEARGVEVSADMRPDMYDDTVYSDAVEISQTSKDDPAKTAVYYGQDDFTVSAVMGKTVSKLENADSNGAVKITGNKVEFTSGFFTSVELKVTLDDGTVGYILVERLGIEVDVVRPNLGLKNGNETVYKKAPMHGNERGTEVSKATGANEYNIVATFYYDKANTYKDFDVVANLTFADGHTETKVVEGYGETACHNPNLKGGDYLVWSAASGDNAPTSVSVTAVKHGATFGGGKGVTVTPKSK